MKTKFYFLIVLSSCLFCFANGQIGAATIASIPLAATEVGNGSDYGKSTLPVCTPRSVSCSQAFTYTFTGSGNWTIESNWDDNVIPPQTLPQGAIIIINPVSGGECVLNRMQTIASGAFFRVKAGKKIKLLSNLRIQN